MKHPFFYIPLLILVMAACNGKKNTTTESAADIQNADTLPVEIIPELPPLIAGEVFLKGQSYFKDENIVISGTHIEEPDTFIFRPGEPKMVIKDSLLIMSSYNAPFYIFRYPEFTHKKTIGIRGNGPDEFLNPIAVQSLDPAYLCYLLDGYSGRLYGVGSDLEKHFIKSIFDPASRRDYIEHAYPINEKALIYRMGSYITQTSLEGDSVRTQKLYNVKLEKAKKLPVHGSLCVNAQRNRIVYAYKYAKIVKFMDPEAKTVRTLNFEQSGFDEQTLGVTDGLDANVSHYIQALPTRDYVYITYSGRTPYAVAADNQKGDLYMYLEKYDWNGNPIKRYKMLDFCVYNVIDEKTNKMVLSTYYHDDPFVVYQLEK